MASGREVAKTRGAEKEDRLGNGGLEYIRGYRGYGRALVGPVAGSHAISVLGRRGRVQL